MSVTLGIDIGTSGTKTIAIDDKGTILASATAEYPCDHPRPGWSEQDPELWWDATKKTVGQVMTSGRFQRSDVIGVGLSGQMHGSVFLDAAGQVIRPALLWNDQRTAVECEEIESRAGGREALIRLVANPASPDSRPPSCSGCAGTSRATGNGCARSSCPRIIFVIA